MNKPFVWLVTILFLVSATSTHAQQPTKVPRIGYLNDGALKCADVVVSTIPV